MSFTSPCLKMNFNRKTQCDSQGSIENIPPTTKTDMLPIQRGKQRTVLGVLSENEQRGRSLSQASQCSKHSSTADRSHIKLHSSPSTSSFDVYVEEACEVVLTASGDEVFPGSCPLDIEHFALQNQNARILLELNSSSCQDDSVQSDPFLMSEGVPCMNEYAKDIHQHLRESEMRFRPKPGYLENHPELTSYMRVILVDWMVEVVREFKLQSETLHLAVNYVDRFLSRTANVKRDMLQLVGTAALMIAAKYEEIFPPDMDEFVYTTDRTYTRVQLTNMELLLLKVLGYRMAPPTINQFLSLFVSIQSVCATTENLALYVAELCLLEIDVILRYTPSVVAAAAYSLASYTVKDSLWPEILQDFSGYTMADILPCIIDLHKLYISAETHPQQAIREKYKISKYYCVSLIPPPAIVLFT